jgi:phosphoribosylanthranilate isomerase
VQAGLEAVPQALLQFHGDETPAQCAKLAAVGGVSRAWIRAARVAPGFNLLDFSAQYTGAAAVLLDAHVEGYGGGGKTFDWSLIPAGGPARLVLSGGLNPANVTDGIHRVMPWAVDVSSGVESAKGIKDAALVQHFCDEVRRADARLGQPG